METNTKRKRNPPAGAPHAGVKRSKGGNQGKWKTPSHLAKLAAVKGRSLELGDMGFWVTCQRQKEMRAADEIISICDEYGLKLFGAGICADEYGPVDQDPEDIEAAIAKEVAALKPGTKLKDGPFDLLRMNVDCVLFMRTRAPVDPLLLVREICKDASAASDRSQWRSRFINKLTPISYTAKATEKGLEELAERILPEHFQLERREETEGMAGNDDNRACSYAIRPTIRAHTTLKREVIINKVANMISNRHKVELKSPDKVILIEVFQTFCGMCVVGSDWEAMRRYNIHELYSAASKRAVNPAGAANSNGLDGQKPEAANNRE
ncbi:hypothetical protein GGS20DRAFT_596324 [Poronia punctata]|nr:hypothetical protein GGS20DRAFT_596324 [Poronia punctata]